MHRRAGVALLAIKEWRDRAAGAVVATSSLPVLHGRRFAVEQRLWHHSHVFADLDVGVHAARGRRCGCGCLAVLLGQQGVVILRHLMCVAVASSRRAGLSSSTAGLIILKARVA
jgi:hypothetical protein